MATMKLNEAALNEAAKKLRRLRLAGVVVRRLPQTQKPPPPALGEHAGGGVAAGLPAGTGRGSPGAHRPRGQPGGMFLALWRREGTRCNPKRHRAPRRLAPAARQEDHRWALVQDLARHAAISRGSEPPASRRQ